MKKKPIYILLFTIFIILLSGCQCKHVWEPASCTAAKTCIDCGETVGEPLGHNWIGPTCEEAKFCTHCNLVEGEPTGHTYIITEECDFTTCRVERKQICTTCNFVAQSQFGYLESLIKDGVYLFTPKEFCERLEYIAKEEFDNFSYQFTELDGALHANLYFGEGYEAHLYFFYKDTSPVKAGDIDATGIWSVGFLAEDKGHLGSSAFFMACDPKLDNDSVTDVEISCAAAMIQTAEEDISASYFEENGLLYEVVRPKGYMKDGQEHTVTAFVLYASH